MGIRIISLILIFLIPILIFSGNYKGVFFTALSSKILDYDLDLFGFNFSILAYSFIIYLIFNPSIVLKTSSKFGAFLWFDFFLVSLVGLFFLVFLPWQDPYILERTITQRLPFRTIIGIFRTLELIFGIYFIYFIIIHYKIEENFILKSSILLLSVNFFLGLLDYLNILPFSLRTILVPDHYALERFTGLTIEPRAIAQISSSYILFFLPFLKIRSDKIKKLLIYGISISLIMIALSLSSSGAGYLLICLFCYIFIGKVKLRYIFFSLIILAITTVILLNNPAYVDHQAKKIARVTLEAQDTQLQGVPEFFNAFEGFDQSALAFFYYNPRNLFFGVGPNTINIPASAYMSDLMIKIMGTNINTTPVNGFIYTISRTGLIGFLIYFFSIGNYILFFKKKENYLYEILFLASIYFLLYREDSFFFTFAMTAAFYHNKLFPKRNGKM